MTIAVAMKPPQVLLVSLADLEPSPSNPRKTFNDLDELADDIKLRGVLLPLIVRLLEGKRYQIVAGERRWRAAKIAGVDQVPVLVRDLTDLEVLEIQIVENAKRADIHPIEEAEAYRALRDVHHLSVDEIAVKVGKSKRVVHERLLLCQLAGPVKTAALKGELPAAQALLIARIPDVKLQAEALKVILDGDEPLSYRDAVDLVHRKFMLQLAHAPFDTADEKLLAAAGSCAKCPKRTGNQRELFSDVKSPDVCTDPTCYRKKVEASAEGTLKKHAEKGRKVLRGQKALDIFLERFDGEHAIDHNSGFVPIEAGQRYVEGRGYMDVAAAVKKDPKIEVVVVAHPDSGKAVELVRVKALPEVKGRAAYGTRNYAAAQKTREENEKRRQTFANSILEPLVVRAERDFGKPELIAVVLALIAERAFYGTSSGLGQVIERRTGKVLGYTAATKAGEKLKKDLPTKSEAELRGLLFELAVMNRYSAEGVWKGTPEGNLAAAAEALGVDVKQAKKDFEAAQKAPKAKEGGVCILPGCGQPGGKVKGSPGLWCEAHAKLSQEERKSIALRAERLAGQAKKKGRGGKGAAAA